MTVKTTTAESTTYCTVPDVQALTPARVFGQGTNPTTADVQLYLELVEAEVNAVLVNKDYAVPVSEALSPMAYALMRRICLQGTVAQIEVSAGNGPNIDRTRAIYEKSLERLSEARTVLDAAKNDLRSKPRGPGVTTIGQALSQQADENNSGAAPGTGNANEPNNPFFTRGQAF